MVKQVLNISYSLKTTIWKWFPYKVIFFQKFTSIDYFTLIGWTAGEHLWSFLQKSWCKRQAGQVVTVYSSPLWSHDTLSTPVGPDIEYNCAFRHVSEWVIFRIIITLSEGRGKLGSEFNFLLPLHWSRKLPSQWTIVPKWFSVPLICISKPSPCLQFFQTEIQTFFTSNRIVTAFWSLSRANLFSQLTAKFCVWHWTGDRNGRRTRVKGWKKGLRCWSEKSFCHHRHSLNSDSSPMNLSARKTALF